MSLNISAAKTQFSKVNLPDEIFNHIFNYLDLKTEVLPCRLINKELSERVSSFWWDPKPLNYSNNLWIQRNIKLNSHKFEIFNDPLKNNEDNRAILGDMHLHGDRLAVVDRGSSIFTGIKIWDLHKKKISHVIQLFYNTTKSLKNPNPGSCVRIHEDYVYVVNHTELNDIEVWDLKKGTFENSKYATGIFLQSQKDKIQQLEDPPESHVFDIQVSSNAVYSSSSVGDDSIMIWDRESGKRFSSFRIQQTIKRILIDHPLIFGLSRDRLTVIDSRSQKPGPAFGCQQLNRFYSMCRDDNEVYIGKEDGKISLYDVRFNSCNDVYSNLSTRITQYSKIYSTKYDRRISNLVLEGNYLFSHSSRFPRYEDLLDSLDYNSPSTFDFKDMCYAGDEDDNEVIEVFDKRSGESLHILKETSFSQKIKGWKETIKKIQMHKGILYTSSQYEEGYSIIQDLFKSPKSMIKSWNFNKF